MTAYRYATVRPWNAALPALHAAPSLRPGPAPYAASDLRRH
ncbi:hypothetical protein [Streptomyces sp. SID8014]|nr:hypothetical protein [Streptomyces sp. SID8014]